MHKRFFLKPIFHFFLLLYYGTLYIYIYYFTLCEFTLKSKWQQVSSGHQDSSKYYNSAEVWMVSIFSVISCSSSLFHGFQLRLLSLSPSCCIIFELTGKIFFSFFCFLFLLSGLLENQNSLVDKFPSCYSKLVGIEGFICISKFTHLFFLWWFPACAYIIYYFSLHFWLKSDSKSLQVSFKYSSWF